MSNKDIGKKSISEMRKILNMPPREQSLYESLNDREIRTVVKSAGVSLRAKWTHYKATEQKKIIDAIKRWSAWSKKLAMAV